MQRAGKLERLTYTLRFYWPFLLGGVLLLLVLGGVVAGWLHQEPEPDYSIAWMTAETPTQEELDAVHAAFESVADDRNGDGQILVQIEQFAYASEKTEQNGSSLGEAYESVAETVWFSAEYREGDCVIYLLEPETMEALQSLDSELFQPLSQCVEGVETDTIPLNSVISLGNQWEETVIAVRNPPDPETQQTEYEASWQLLERLLAAKTSQ